MWYDTPSVDIISNLSPPPPHLSLWRPIEVWTLLKDRSEEVDELYGMMLPLKILEE